MSNWSRMSANLQSPLYGQQLLQYSVLSMINFWDPCTFISWTQGVNQICLFSFSTFPLKERSWLIIELNSFFFCLIVIVFNYIISNVLKTIILYILSVFWLFHAKVYIWFLLFHLVWEWKSHFFFLWHYSTITQSILFQCHSIVAILVSLIFKALYSCSQ